NYDHNSHLRRAQPHREGQNVSKKGAAGKYAEVMTGKAGGKFRPGRCEGLFYAEGQDFGTSRGAVGKRYERGLTCAAGHGVPGVLLPSQPRSGNVALRGRFMARGSQPVKDMRGTRYLGRAERRIYAD
uniref:hypothetical protein n=1 Tax=Varibaculum sp. TaxID=1895474 RepID=UPI0025D884CF